MGTKPMHHALATTLLICFMGVRVGGDFDFRNVLQDASMAMANDLGTQLDGKDLGMLTSRPCCLLRGSPKCAERYIIIRYI